MPGGDVSPVAVAASRARHHVHLRPRQDRHVPAVADSLEDQRRREPDRRTVKVWTSDSYVSYYRIIRVRKTVNAMAGVISLTHERLWLQTSTGPNRTYPKLIIEASRYKTVKTTYAAAHPRARPVSC